MTDLNSLMIFAKVVEAKSFSHAGRRLGIPLSTVSRRVRDLEAELGVRLLERSTRRLRLTEIGAEVYEHAQRSADLSEAVEHAVSRQLRTVSGLLRLSAPPSISDTLLVPLVSAFQATHPDVRMQVFVTERMVDPIAEGIDLVLRIGALESSSLVARKLLRYRHQLVASPAYLANCKVPKTPRDLLAHRLLTFAHLRDESRWHFFPSNKAPKAERETLRFFPHLAMNDYLGLAAALVSGAGIGELPPVVQPHLLRTGKLVEVMSKWRFRTHDLSLLHLGNRYVSRPLRAFMDFAVEMAPQIFPTLPR